MTSEHFAKGMTFDDYVKFAGSPENLRREGFDVRRFSLAKPRVDWSEYLRERHARARLSDEQTAAIKWLAAQPGGPAKVLVIAEDWSSDCRRDVPYLARLAEAGGLELRIFTRDAESMLAQLYRDGRRQAELALRGYEENQAADALPQQSPYSLDDIFREDWYPEPPGEQP